MNAMVRPPRCAWMTPEGMWSGYATAPENTWRDLSGRSYAEDYFAYSTVPVTLAPGATAIVTINIQDDSVFEWESFTATADPGTAALGAQLNVLAQVQDVSANRNLSNLPIPVSCFGAQGNFAMFLPVPRRFMQNGVVQITLKNFDTALTYNNLQFTMIGRKIFSFSRGDVLGRIMPQFRSWRGLDGRTYCEDLYVYTWPFADTAAIAAATTVNTNLIIDADADFEWIATNATGLRNATTGTPTSTLLANMQITDQGSGRQLFSVATHMSNIAGFIGQTFINPSPRTFLAKSPVQLAVSNVDVVTLNNIQLALIGRKIFRLD